MVNVIIIGLDGNVESFDDCKIKIKSLLRGLSDCKVTTMQKSDSTLVTDPERSDPYLIIEYEKNDVASNRVYEAIKRLELGAIQMRVVLRPVLLEQSRPNAASMERILNKTSL